MPQIINTNMASLNAQRNLGSSQNALATSLQRLSSGLRINSAKDDAAGLAISSRMTSQINGLAQAARNANDGISMAQTAEGALQQISDNLQRMRELSVQAANGSNSSSDRSAIQAEISQLQQEITRVASQTAFNGTNLIDGSLNNAQFQVGANANQTINAQIGDARANAIGSYTLTSGGANTTGFGYARVSTGGVFNTSGSGASAQTLTVSGNGVSVTTASSGTSSSATVGTAAGSAYQFAQLVNTTTAQTGVSATARTTATLSAFTAGTVSLTLYGAPTSAGNANAITVSASLASSTDVSGLAAAINAQSGVSGITAVADTVNGTVALTQSSGYDIGIKNAAAGSVNFSVTGSIGTLSSLTVNGTAVVGGTVSFTGSSTYTVSSSAGLALAATRGSIFNAAATVANASTLSSVAAVDVTTLTNGIPSGANSAIDVIDAAVATINNQRAALGAMQNRFQSVVANLQTSQENLTASRSRIQDTDFAHETAQLTRAQILQQAGTAMLAQANSLPNGVLALLR